MKTTIQYRAYPFINRGLKLIRADRPLSRFVIETDVLCPEETSTFPPVDMDPNDWDAITAFQHETSQAAERSRIRGGPRTHTATVRKTVRKSLATPKGSYVLGKSFNQNGTIPVTTLLRSQISYHERGFNALSGIAIKYFGHWLTDAVPTALLAREGEQVYLPANPAWPHAAAYLGLLGLKTVQTPLAVFGQMSFANDIGMNSGRRARLCEVRDRLHAAVPAPAEQKGVFIRRGRSGSTRLLLNEENLAQDLAARGFNICASDDPLDKILIACRNARTVVSMEGSHVAHALLAAHSEARIVTLNPSDRFNAVYSDYMEALGQSLATTVIPRDGTGYRVDNARVMSLLS